MAQGESDAVQVPSREVTGSKLRACPACERLVNRFVNGPGVRTAERRRSVDREDRPVGNDGPYGRRREGRTARCRGDRFGSVSASRDSEPVVLGTTRARVVGIDEVVAERLVDVVDAAGVLFGLVAARDEPVERVDGERLAGDVCSPPVPCPLGRVVVASEVEDALRLCVGRGSDLGEHGGFERRILRTACTASGAAWNIHSSSLRRINVRPSLGVQYGRRRDVAQSSTNQVASRTQR